MDVLNTYGGGFSGLLLVLTLISGVLAIFFIISAIVSCAFSGNSSGLIIPAVLFTLITVLLAVSIKTPVRHEVTLRPGGVIDAVKYDIIEQRGAIFVIEERTPAE